MKVVRIIKRFVIVLLALIVMTGCSSRFSWNNSKEELPEDEGKIEMVYGDKSTLARSDYQEDGVITITLDKEDYSKEEMAYYKIENQSPYKLEFGADTFFEINIEGAWRTVSFTNTAVKSIAYELEPGSEGNYNHSTARLKTGTYRIVQRVELITGDREKEEIYLISDSFSYTAN